MRLNLQPGSPLYHDGPGGDAIRAPKDEVIWPSLAATGGWSRDLSFRLAKSAKPGSLLLDIGAHVGLISRQALLAFGGIEKAVCFEPNPDLHTMLTENLNGLNAEIAPFGLGARAETVTLYCEPQNSGNNIARGGAFVPKTAVPRQIQLASTDAALTHLAAKWSGPLVWKSDIQGMDQEVFVAAPGSIMDRIEIGVMELWRRGMDRTLLAEFADRLTQFPHLFFRHNGAEAFYPVKALEIADWSFELDGRFGDLVFSRSALNG